MRNYGVTVSDILASIRSNRKGIAFWSAKNGDEFRISVSDGKRAEIVKSHTDNIRDLRIMLLSVRFPENTFPTFAYGDDFTPYVVTDSADDSESVSDDSVDTLSDSDRAAIVDAMVDHAESVTGELISA